MPPPQIHTLSLHDALPISHAPSQAPGPGGDRRQGPHRECRHVGERRQGVRRDFLDGPTLRSEEHTSELQSRFDLVCRLLLEKKKTTTFNLEAKAMRHGCRT